MAKPTNRVRSSTTDVFSKIPNLYDLQDGVLEKLEELDGIRALVRILGQRKNGASRQIASYLFEKIEVDFSTQYRHEHVFFDHTQSVIVVRAPKRRGEREAALELRRRQILVHYTSVADEMRMRGAIQVWRSLGKKAKHALIQQQRRLDRSTKKSRRRRK